MHNTFPLKFVKTSVVQEEVKQVHESSGESKAFIRGLRPIVFLGRIFGVISRTDVLSQRNQKWKINAASFFSCALVTFTLLNAILLLIYNFKKFQQDSTTLVRIEGFHHSVYACSMSFIYCYQFFATTKFRSIVQSFLDEGFPQRKGLLSFSNFSVMATFTCLFLGIVENALFDWQNLTRGGKQFNTSLSLFERSYIHYFKHLHVIMPHYNGVTTFILMVLIKLGTYGWFHMDTVCIVLCRAIWEKLKLMDENLDMNDSTGKKDEVIQITNDKLEYTTKDKSQFDRKVDWDTYRDEYIRITQLTQKVEKYICPLVLACYAGNIYIIIVMLFNWIGPLSTEGTSRKEQFIHICFAFFQYSFRVATITYFASEVHQMSMLLRRKIQSCPTSDYSASVERLGNTLTMNPTGICLLGSFVISRKYFISILSFIFSTEIILLQTYSSYYVAKSLKQ